MNKDQRQVFHDLKRKQQLDSSRLGILEQSAYNLLSSITEQNLQQQDKESRSELIIRKSTCKRKTYYAPGSSNIGTPNRTGDVKSPHQQALATYQQNELPTRYCHEIAHECGRRAIVHKK